MKGILKGNEIRKENGCAEQVRSDLKEIRYYYQRKRIFDAANGLIGENRAVVIAERYNRAICKSIARLYDLYNGLYIRGLTQTAYADEIAYTPEYVQILHKQLLIYLQKEIYEKVL